MDRQNLHILYAEDEISNRELLAIKLQRAGFDITGVRDGELAWQTYQQRHYDLVILDHYMPKMDGLDVAMRIREVNQDIPIIGITSNDGLIKTLQAAGFNAVLIKPIRGTAIVDLIRDLLHIPAPSQPSP